MSTEIRTAGRPAVDRQGELVHLLELVQDRSPSAFSQHTAPCCRIALEWFRAMAHAAPEDPPRWIMERWRWGPTRWPLFWCEAVRRRELDCGGLAALAEAAFQAKGATVCRVQLVLEHELGQIDHWRARWRAEPAAPDWIRGRLVYHEAVAVLSSSSLKIWDPTEGRWRERASAYGGRIVAMKLTQAEGAARLPQVLEWESMVPVECWSVVS